MTLCFLERGEQPRLRLSRPRRQQEEDRAVGAAVEQVADHVERRGIGPVQIIQRQHQRSSLGDPGQQGAERASEAMSVELLDRPGIDLRLQRVGEHGEWKIGFELRRSARQHEEAACLGTLERLADQRGLADAGFAGETHGATLATGEPLE